MYELLSYTNFISFHPECIHGVDAVILYDDSGSISNRDFITMKDFILKLMDSVAGLDVQVRLCWDDVESPSGWWDCLAWVALLYIEISREQPHVLQRDIAVGPGISRLASHLVNDSFFIL